MPESAYTFRHSILLEQNQASQAGLGIIRHDINA